MAVVMKSMKSSMKAAPKAATGKRAAKGAKSAKAMKVSKAKKVMTSMKAKRVSVVASGRLARALVLRGTKARTVGGLSKEDLLKNSRGKIVSKAMSALSRRRFASSAAKAWADAVRRARKELQLQGFVAVGGKSGQGQALLAKTKALYKKA